MRRPLFALLLAGFIAVALLISLYAQAPRRSASPAQVAASPPAPSPTPTPGEKPPDNTAAILTAVAALIASLLTGAAALVSARKVSKESAQASATLRQEQLAFQEQFEKQLMDKTDLFERCMRDVLTRVPQNESIWRLIFDRLGAEEARRKEEARKKEVEALLLELSSPQNVARLRGLFTDESKAAKIAEEGSPAEQAQIVRLVAQSLGEFLQQQKEDKPDPPPGPGEAG